MRLKVKKICIILLVLLFIPQALLASGNMEQIKTLQKDREAWSAKSKVLSRYSKELSETGLDLTGIAVDSEDKQLQYAAECVIDISNVVGLLETMYTLNANCSQTYLTIRNLYKQILIALSHTSNVTDYNKLKIDELYNKTKDTDALHLIGEGREIIKKLQKTLADEREDMFSKLRKIKK